MKKIVAIMMAMIMVISVTVVLAGSAADNGTNKEPVIIGFENTPGPADEAMVRGHGGDIKYSYTIINAIAAKLPEPAIENILKTPRVTYVEMDGEVHTLDAELDNSWGVKRIGAGNVHDGGNKGAGVKVAIIDTGIDYDHPDLDANFGTLLGYDFANDDSEPMDDNGHGTHCAGIVAAEDNGEGVVGVAPGAHLYAVKVLDGSGSGYESDVIAGIQWSKTNNMDVISMSLGSDFGSISLKKACDNAYSSGVLLVAAAGNDGYSSGKGNTVDYPARYSSVIAVAATDSNDIRARWSSTGPDVELAAPGVSIYSTYLGGGYATMSGTSMACPHVAGTAALVIAAGKGDVRQYLQDTADDLGAAGKDNLYGYGLVDADEAVPPAPNDPPVANAGGSYPGTEDVAITFDGSDSYDLNGDSLTYAWDFGDGSTGTSVTTTHTYTAGGIYTVTLVVNDGKADSEPSTTTADITEVNDPPVADAGSDQNVVVDEVVTFDGSGSYDLDGTITDYVWEFGDGTDGTTGMTTPHTYVTAGKYTANLTVTDNGTLTGNDTAIVTVTEVPAYTMHVASIVMSTDSKTRGRNTFVWAVATVTIVDESKNPVDGATVSGYWSDATSDSDSGVTDANGQISLKSDSVKTPPSGTTFTFTVDDVAKTDRTYDSSANIETDDSITV
ncbi:MAG: S8 family serine peptidase [Euryarchaeota archaeon]|nr:S8 family serine peptidase [Euryarchaeota archaeon]